MSKEFEYKIEYEADSETGQVVATVPELNHTSSFGNSFAEAEANVREAVLGYLEVLKKEGGEIPKPAFHTEGTYLKLLVPSSF
ncbi:MAG: type II toxin-antitoxin system HicB family antitoxin [Minisyncoccia bacterium]